ncbi:hypothetical protein KC19_11G015500 [Ceratodon purpureus]|uniref:Uncharacterized protein n=1 Tax=Ceratodon purpureus TaxID=3225 RepID=A0A8T0GB69_CERPU|nr:hypothetical protein KC19_11G015500 [Ceratodon purpureus]
MEDVESERRISRRKRKLSTQQGVIIGVAAVASLGLMTKLLSFLRREKPKKIEDGDIETLEAVLSGDAAKSALPPQTAEVHVFANLENDEPSHEETNGHEASPPSFKNADVEESKKDDVTENGENHVSQDLVGDRDVADTNGLTTEESEASPVSQEEVKVKEMHHLNGGEVEVKHDNEDAVESHLDDQVENTVEVHIEEDVKANGEAAVTELHVEEKGKPHIEEVEQLLKLVESQSKDEVKPDIEDAAEVQTEVETKQPNGHALEVLEDVEKLHSEDAVELPVKGESHHNEDVVELRNEDEAKPHTEEVEKLDTEEAEKPHIEEAEKPRIEEAEKPRIEEAEKPRIEEAEKPRIEEAEKPRIEEAEKPRIEEAEKPRIEEAEKPQAEEAEKPQAEEAEKPQTEEAEKPRSYAAALHEDEEKLETKDEEKLSSEDVAELPMKVEKEHQIEDEELKTEDEGKLHIEEAA